MASQENSIDEFVRDYTEIQKNVKSGRLLEIADYDTINRSVQQQYARLNRGKLNNFDSYSERMTNCCREHGYDCLECCCGNIPDREKKAARRICLRTIDAALYKLRYVDKERAVEALDAMKRE